jgi:hypothetical protein
MFLAALSNGMVFLRVLLSHFLRINSFILAVAVSVFDRGVDR